MLWRQHARRRLRLRGSKQSGAANLRGPWPQPWGPHCYLRQGRHPAPFNKRRDGAARRAARLEKQRRQQALLPRDVEYDDGYFPLGT